MEPESSEGMSQFLEPTALCNSDNPRVSDKAKDLAGDGQDARAAALKIFSFVRDDISFGLHYPDTKASKTLDLRRGFCATKTNLQMALLRAAGIPSRCHLALLPKEVNKGWAAHARPRGIQGHRQRSDEPWTHAPISRRFQDHRRMGQGSAVSWF